MKSSMKVRIESPQRVHTCIGIIPPNDRLFDDGKAVLARQIKQLRVETETLDGLERENDLRRLLAKSFEPALGVADTRHQHQLDDDVPPPVR